MKIFLPNFLSTKPIEKGICEFELQKCIYTFDMFRLVRMFLSIVLVYFVLIYWNWINLYIWKFLCKTDFIKGTTDFPFFYLSNWFYFILYKTQTE